MSYVNTKPYAVVVDGEIHPPAEPDKPSKKKAAAQVAEPEPEEAES